MRICLFKFNFFAVSTVDAVFTVCSVDTVNTVLAVFTVFSVDAVCAVDTVFAVFARRTRKFRNGDKIVPFTLPCAPLNMRVGFPELGIIIKFTDFYKFVPLAFGRIFPHNGVTACLNFNIIGAFSAPRNKHKRKHRNSAKRG